MSVGKHVGEGASESGGGGGKRGGGEAGCFPGLELAMEAGPLRELDAEKLKNEIKRWAKAVVAYARQLSMGARPRSTEGR